MQTQCIDVPAKTPSISLRDAGFRSEEGAHPAGTSPPLPAPGTWQVRRDGFAECPAGSIICRKIARGPSEQAQRGVCALSSRVNSNGGPLPGSVDIGRHAVSPPSILPSFNRSSIPSPRCPVKGRYNRDIEGALGGRCPRRKTQFSGNGSDFGVAIHRVPSIYANIFADNEPVRAAGTNGAPRGEGFQRKNQCRIGDESLSSMTNI